MNSSGALPCPSAAENAQVHLAGLDHGPGGHENVDGWDGDEKADRNVGVEIKDVHYLRENGGRDQLCLLNVQQQWGFCKCELKRARGYPRSCKPRHQRSTSSMGVLPAFLEAKA